MITTCNEDFKMVSEAVPVFDAFKRYCDGKIERRGSNGKNWTRCVFHNDENPSMVIYNNGGFKCYSCGVAGRDSIKFVGKLFNISPYESMKKLADDFGITISKRKKLDRKKVQHFILQDEKLNIQAEYLKNKLNSFYHNLCVFFKCFRDLKEFADKENIDKLSIEYQYLEFNYSFFDRQTEKFALSNDKTRIDMVLNFETVAMLE